MIMNDPIDRDQAIVEIVRCKDCKHRPYSEDGERTGFSVKVPEEDRYRYICPCICDDGFYSYIPKNDFYCANGERKGENESKDND